MKLIHTIIGILVSISAGGRADTYRFPDGETPAISIIEAAKSCEKMSEKAGIGKFNPSSCELMGNKDPGAGGWVFKQFSKAGEEYSFIIYFPENTGFVIRVKDDTQIAAFRIEGQKVIRLPDPAPEPQESDDPFEDEATPVHPRPATDKNRKPTTRPQNIDSTGQQSVRSTQLSATPKNDKVK